MTSSEDRDALKCIHCGRAYTIRANTPEMDPKRFYCGPRCWRESEGEWARRVRAGKKRLKDNICAWCRKPGAGPVYQGDESGRGPGNESEGEPARVVWKYMHLKCLLKWEQLHAVRKN